MSPRWEAEPGTGNKALGVGWERVQGRLRRAEREAMVTLPQVPVQTFGHLSPGQIHLAETIVFCELLQGEALPRMTWKGRVFLEKYLSGKQE